ncbi:diacylglycerol kinase [Azoarcus indigens]|uniref:Diacylglycerol kinase family enzyme n=1 Tax=Azoarcus indigens TaxID=29545 RepID=A0A4R6DTY9_9RHOO|nr:diacylglycerol kinase family protein [Azoarcus indigens]NMG66553.1 diacylglycerol kinase [Azoarcus indigens]TDN48144.1 diacylglycerol kinase family enzyme [Azoarcus indigens]
MPEIISAEARPLAQPAQAARPLHLIANRASGSGEGPRLEELAAERCRELGRELVVHVPDSPSGLAQAAERARRAAQADGGVVIAAGGDGTVRTVAQVLAGSEVPMAVVPIGTFNFFARNYRIPEDMEGALEVALHGQPQAVNLGQVNGHVFLVNASFGLYAKAIAERERSTSRFGRNRAVVIASTVISMLRGHPVMDVELEIAGVSQRVRTPMVFVGNNALQLKDVSLDVARCMGDGQLAVVVLRPVSWWGMLKLTLNGLLRMLSQEQSLESFCAHRLLIRRRRGRVRVALDGELLRLETPLEFRSWDDALSLMSPPLAEARRTEEELTAAAPGADAAPTGGVAPGSVAMKEDVAG